MLPSMYSGISGLKANQKKLDVVGNNIANSSTTGFKGQRIRFADMINQNISEATGASTNIGGINGKQVGLGVQVEGIDNNMAQGNMQSTSRVLDFAVDGAGYFVVATGPLGADSNDTQNQIHLDDTTNALGTTGDTGVSKLTPKFTRDGALTLDSQGNLLTSDGSRVLGYSITGGDITYSSDPNAQHSIKFVNANDAASPVTVNRSSGLVPLVIPDVVTTDNGTARIDSLSVSEDGLIKAHLTDGSTAALGQMAMASFKNDSGLKKLGNNEYQTTSNSGQPIIRSGKNDTTVTDNSGAYGNIRQNFLEMSNVDLAEQFTDMIVASRAFQANGKIISTGDEILQDLVNLKR